MESGQNTLETRNKRDSRSVGIIKDSRGQGEKKQSSLFLGVMCGNHSTNLGKSNMVAEFSRIKSGLDRFGKAPRQEIDTMEFEEWSYPIMDCILDPNKEALLVEGTRNRRRAIVKKFIAWCCLNGNLNYNSEVEMKDVMKLLTQNVGVYLEDRTKYTSGENVRVTGRTLFSLFGKHLSEQEKERLELLLKKLRMEGNMRNPPVRKAADALKLEDLHSILDNPRYLKLKEAERQAIDVLIVAFSTVSRVAEIVSLTTRDVTENGQFISVRTKTGASTCQRHLKRVSNGFELQPVQILKRQRAVAILQGRTLLYPSKGNSNIPISSSDVTRELKNVTRKLNLNCRITAHSGRKGAAVAALLAGVPLVIIQSLGLWKCVDSLQAYIGEALRREFGILDLLKMKF